MMKIVKFVFGYFCIGLVTGRAVVTKIMVTSLQNMGHMQDWWECDPKIAGKEDADEMTLGYETNGETHWIF